MLSPEMLRKQRVSSPWQPELALETCSVLSLLISVDGGRVKYYYSLNGMHCCQRPAHSVPTHAGYQGLCGINGLRVHTRACTYSQTVCACVKKLCVTVFESFCIH